jgi:hypothetical protein
MKTFTKVIATLAFVPIFILLMMFGLIAVINVALSGSH